MVSRHNSILNILAILLLAVPANAQTPEKTSSPSYAPLEKPYLTPEIPLTPPVIPPEAFASTLQTIRTQSALPQPSPLTPLKTTTAPYEIPALGEPLNVQTLGSPQLAQSSDTDNSYSRQRRRYENAQYSSGFSYLGLGGTLGLQGRSSLGDSGGTLLTRMAFTENLSFRPSVIIGDGTTLLVPFTYDFPISREPYGPPVTIFVGGGFGFDLKQGNHGPLISTGVDIPLANQFSFNATLNTAFFEEREIEWGLTLGFGYNFPGLLSR